MQDKPQLLQRSDQASILIVDDEDIIRDLCARTLKDYRLLQAENGKEALDLLARESVDLILVDVMMPIMNGLDLLQKVKQDDPDQLVIIMTGYADKDIILRALKAEADDFIQKPINLLQLRTAVEKALEKKRLRREISELKQLDRMKADFLGLISHKLRTPTTSISLFIQNLASGAIAFDDENFKQALSAIRDESDYLAYLISDLLYYSDFILRDATPKVTKQDVRDIAIAVLAEKRDAAMQKNLALKSTLNGNWPPLYLDRQRISFALSALLDNAIKFTQEGGEVVLSGTIERTELRLSITDNGPGIAENELPKVFEKFYQIDPGHTGQVRGFGLGLFYARQFIRDHGGSLELTSASGSGTTATIVLPRKSFLETS
ncbi:MAG: response regulator [Deltaproteobacteria bacterium]|jgi:signal transduction histidine kinase|nr:response regulator [Deltaproteobacteria bacterium]